MSGTKSHFFLRPLGLLVSAVLVVSVMAVVLASPAHAATYTVTNTNDSGAGSLREAIDQANATTGVADTIDFAPSLSGQTITLASQLPTILPSLVPADSPGLTIDGGSTNITISGNDQVRVLEVGAGARLTLNKLTVTNGKASGFPDGGGIYNKGLLTVSDSTISGNSASGNGGGIGNVGMLTVSDSTISANSASGGGGGVWNVAPGTTATVGDSTISGNRANFGGGIWNSDYAYVTVSDSTISANSAALEGGGIFNIAEGTGTLRNTIVANSTSGGDCAGKIFGFGDGGSVADDGYNLDSDASCGFVGVSTTSLSGVDPKLGPLADNGGPTKTHALLTGSPAIDAIPQNTSGCGTTSTKDQRGVSRPQGSACDIGAFELKQNAAPQAGDDAYSTNEDSTLKIAAPGVLSNDTDRDGDALRAVLVSGPTHGALTFNAEGSFAYTSTANFNGTDAFTYRTSDGAAASNVATVTITVSPVNDPPRVGISGGACLSDALASGGLELTVEDLDDPASSLSVSATSDNQSLIPDEALGIGGSGADRTLALAAAPRQSGTATITLSVSDDSGGVSTPDVTVMVGTQDPDTITGTSGADVIFGLAGRGTLDGSGGQDLVCGGNANDEISGGDGNDVLDGSLRDDNLNGEAGDDVLLGDVGRDTLTGGTGGDSFDGGWGTDTATDFDAGEGDTQSSIP